MEIQFDIRDLRSRLQWKRSELANYLGLDLSTVSRLENGQAPQGSTFRLLRMLDQAWADVEVLSVLLKLAGDEHETFNRDAN